MTRRYNPSLSTAAGNRKRLRGQPDTGRAEAGALRRQMARILVENDCAEGRHRPETDTETGDEVCRYCKTVIDDYSDVAPASGRVRDNEGDDE